MQTSEPAPFELPNSDFSVSSRLRQVESRIAAATAEAGRPARSVTLVAVSKTHPASAIQEAIEAGQTVFGENRVQEIAAKFPSLRTMHPQLVVHLIGNLQTNKARDAVRVADVIESLDRPRLADALADAAAKEGRMPRLLVQVNVGDEAQKAGVSRAEADSFIQDCRARFGDAVSGLMCIPPADCDPAPHFAWLAACAAHHGLPVVSMGMSADYETAIACGATHVRVGSAIFGSREAPPAVPLDR